MIFTEKELYFMRNVLCLDLDFNNLSDDDWILIENKVADALCISGFDENYKPTFVGSICEGIIDKLP